MAITPRIPTYPGKSFKTLLRGAGFIKIKPRSLITSWTIPERKRIMVRIE